MNSWYTSQKLHCLLLVVTVLCGCIEGYKQEVWVYFDDRAPLYFDQAVPDLSRYRSILKGQKKVCSRGLWYTYEEKNYITFDRVLGGYEGTTEQLFCFTTGTDPWNSLRHQGTSDTSVESVSLYTGEVWSGKQYVFTASGKTGISENIQSIGVTGRSNWAVYEGINYSGKSKCYKGAPDGKYFNAESGFGPLTVVGSVKKGCNP